MTLATVGWGVVWGSLAVAKLGWSAPATWVYALAAGPALLGIVYAIVTVRARRTWLLMACVALFANGTLLALPLLFDEEFRSAL
ncbi:MAG: hypothetical protein AAGA20_07490, partial [Planctomycetota bacterium]